MVEEVGESPQVEATPRPAPRARPSRESGFTLLELIVVVGIIAILAAITIPRLLEGRFAAYEVNAQTYLRSIHQAESAFQSRENRWGTLAELKARTFLGPQGPEAYVVVVTVIPDGSGFNVAATPLPAPGSMKHFYLDGSGVVRFAVGAPADENSTPM